MRPVTCCSTWSFCWLSRSPRAAPILRAPPAREIRSAVDDVVAAMRKADVAAATVEPTVEVEEAENLAAA